VFLIRTSGKFVLCLPCDAFLYCSMGVSPVNWLDITVYTGSHPLCPVCVPSDTLCTLPAARNPHSQQMLLFVVGGNRSYGQVSLIQPHGTVEAILSQLNARPYSARFHASAAK